MLLTCSSVVCGCDCWLFGVLLLQFVALVFVVCDLFASLIVLIVTCVCVVFVVSFVDYCGRLRLCLLGFALCVAGVTLWVFWWTCCLGFVLMLVLVVAMWFLVLLVGAIGGWLVAASGHCGVC